MVRVRMQSAFLKASALLLKLSLNDGSHLELVRITVFGLCVEEFTDDGMNDVKMSSLIAFRAIESASCFA